MTTVEAIRALVARSGKSARAISSQIGKSPNWLSATLGIVSDTKAGTLAQIANACGFDLVLVDREHGETITIDPPVE